MTIPRMVGLLVVLAVVGLGVVVIRVDQAAISQRIQDLQFRQTELRRKLWTQEMELARLRSPGMIRDRAERFGLQAGLADASKEAGKKSSSATAASRKAGTAGAGTRKEAAATPTVRRGERD